MPQNAAVRVLGLAITVLGVILMLYSFAVGPFRGHIGSSKTWTGDAISLLLGWYFIIVGPALYFGEAPAKLRREVAKKQGK